MEGMQLRYAAGMRDVEYNSNFILNAFVWMNEVMRMKGCAAWITPLFFFSVVIIGECPVM